MTDASIAGAERAEHERRARVRDHGSSDRLDHIADELAALRADLATFTKAQDAVNADFRAHVVRSSVLGDLHTGDWETFKREQAGHDVRLRAVEDWRVEMRHGPGGGTRPSGRASSAWKVKVVGARPPARTLPPVRGF